VHNNKPYSTKACLPTILLLTLLLAPFIAQTCSAQPTQLQQDKAISFLSDVIQLDVNHYKITETINQYDVNKISLTYTLEPKSSLAFGESYTLNTEFNNRLFTSFSVQPDSGALVYKQPRQDRFNETLGILLRYQTWLNDPQVGEMADKLRQVGFEQSIFQASGNLSLRIQLYSDVGEYHFNNYINGVEYSGVSITQGRSGSIFFTDNRVSQKIGNTTIDISEDQAIAIAQEYFKSNPPRGTPGSKEITNLNITGVKSVTLKSSPIINYTLYPYYVVEFDVVDQSNQQSCGVNVSANDGEIWGSYSSYTSTNTVPVPVNTSSYHILVIVIITVLCCAAVIIGVYSSRLRFNVHPDTV
jgi:hypothetical protein